MLVLPVFLTRLSSIKVRRENDCKGKTQILKIKKKKQYYQTLTIITKAVTTQHPYRKLLVNKA